MSTEPKVRKDGSCLVCGGARPEAAVKDGDPFCRTECCREHHGTQLPALPSGPAKGEK